jgi:hypothetical protein
LLVSILFLTQADGILLIADKTAGTSRSAAVALDDIIITSTMEQLGQSGEFFSECSRTVSQQARAALLSSQNR